LVNMTVTELYSFDNTVINAYLCG